MVTPTKKQHNEVEEADLFGLSSQYLPIFAFLQLKGVTTIEIPFSGSGDSGAIEAVAFCGDSGPVDRNDFPEMPWATSSDSYNTTTHAWERIYQPDKSTPLATIVEQFGYDILERVGLDWINNDGGQGTVYIDLKTNPPTGRVDIGINQQTTEDFEYTFDAQNITNVSESEV